MKKISFILKKYLKINLILFFMLSMFISIIIYKVNSSNKKQIIILVIDLTKEEKEIENKNNISEIEIVGLKNLGIKIKDQLIFFIKIKMKKQF